MTHLTVAVVIPTIPGREVMLRRALRSVEDQLYRPDQIVIEPDPDRTGAWATRNRALERVTSDVIAWLDDDDWLKPRHLSVCLRVLQHRPSVGLVYSVPDLRGSRDPTATSYRGQWVLPWGIQFGPEQEYHLRTSGSFIPITHLVRTVYVREIGGFRKGYTLPDGRYRGEDEDYLIRLLDCGCRFEHINVQTWNWTAHPETSTAGKGKDH